MEHGFRFWCNSLFQNIMGPGPRHSRLLSLFTFWCHFFLLLILSSLIYQYTKPAYLDIPLTTSFFLSLVSVPLDWVVPPLSDSMKYLKDQVFLAILLEESLRTPACWWTPTHSSLPSASQYSNGLHHITWHFSLLHFPFTLSPHYLGLHLRVKHLNSCLGLCILEKLSKDSYI